MYLVKERNKNTFYFLINVIREFKLEKLNQVLSSI
jgi:hypothetical protein